MKKIAILIRKVGSLFHLCARIIDPSLFSKPKLSEFELELLRFNNDKGVLNYQLNYELNENSLVLDLGGYIGEWSGQIYANYNCNIFLFEPHPDFFRAVKNRFNKNEKIKLFQFGLGNKNLKAQLSSNEFESSIYINRNDSNLIEINIKRFDEVMMELGVKKIDLIKINIEGGEYDLLDHILETGFVENIENLQIQFHNFVENSDSRMEAIQTKLSQTHKPTYQYKYVWENWKRK